jgi:hypothetical protein
MATIFASRKAPRRPAPGAPRLARWLDQVGAPLLLAAVIAVMALAGYNLHGSGDAPAMEISRTLAE